MTDSTMILKGTLAGHSDWVTAIATTEVDSEMIVSASRGACRELSCLASAGRRAAFPHTCTARAPARHRQVPDRLDHHW